jgi:hypothetical protein
MGASTPTARESALGFTEGVRSGWLTSDLIAWSEEHLVQPERLVLAQPGPLQRVREHDLGIVPLQSTSPQGVAKVRSSTNSAVPQFLEVSRQHVLLALRASIETGQLAFANAAVFSSRVLRQRGVDGRTNWCVRLTDDVPLSDQVLALFAADALEHPSDYESDLSVCDACGAVSLNPARSGSRRGCSTHPFGRCDSQRLRSLMPEYGQPARGRATNA